MKTRYEESIEVISRVAAEHPQATTKELRRLVRDAYPYGQRKYWPYKQWLQAQRDFFESRERQRAWAGRPE